MHWQRSISRLNVAIVVFAGLVLCTAIAAQGQISNAPATSSAADLVRTAVKNEVTAAKDTSVKHLFRSRKQTPRGSQTRLYVETHEALAGMTIAYNDQPLTPDQLQGEISHLDGLRSDPEQLRRKQSREKEDSERTMRIVKALPDAFLYEYDSTDKDAGKRGSLRRLTFRPNPNYDPPSRVEQVLTGMQGFVLIDTEAHRVATIDGTLFKDVTFGWGFLAHLDKGGHFLVQQSDVGNGAWAITRMSLNFKGKVLFFKSINIVSDEIFSDFRRVPADTTFAQGVDLLKAEQTRLTQNGTMESHTH